MKSAYRKDQVIMMKKLELARNQSYPNKNEIELVSYNVLSTFIGLQNI